MNNRLRLPFLIGIVSIAVITIGTGILMAVAEEMAKYIFAMGLLGVILAGILAILVATWPSESRDDQAAEYRGYWYHPVTVIGTFLLFAVILMISAHVLGVTDGDVLDKLKGIEYARGVITFLFAIGTIGVIIALVLGALLGEDTEENREHRDRKMARAKDILTVLVGLFGTIVGYYFGSHVGEEPGAATDTIALATPLAPDTLAGGEGFTLLTLVKGGAPPYTYWVSFNSQTTSDQMDASGSIKVNLSAPDADRDTTLTLEINVMDDAGDFANRTKTVFVPGSSNPTGLP